MKKLATFAGGCFWCMEPPFKQLSGVLKVTSGYTGGMNENPTYEEVCSGSTGHTESIQVEFDDVSISYKELLDVFWRNIDPTAINSQFADRGTQYRTGIFYHDEDQHKQAEESKKELADSKKFDKPIVTEITKATAFYLAEDYHQDFYLKNPLHYKQYRIGSGRAAFIEKMWGGKK